MARRVWLLSFLEPVSADSGSQKAGGRMNTFRALLPIALVALILSTGCTTYRRVATITNGGDAPPLAELSRLKVDDLAQIGPGDTVAYIQRTYESLLRCNPVRIVLLVKGTEKPVESTTPAPPRRQPNRATRTREHLTPAEVEKLITSAETVGRYGHRDSTLLLLAYRHGLRVSELVELQWSQVDLQTATLHVERLWSATTKTPPGTACWKASSAAARRRRSSTARPA